MQPETASLDTSSEAPSGSELVDLVAPQPRRSERRPGGAAGDRSERPSRMPDPDPGPVLAAAQRDQEVRSATASDAALARRSGLGDHAAFTELFQRHFQPSFRFALHMLDGDEDSAAEAAQSAWIKAWRNLPDFRGESKFLTWLLTIVSREVLDHRRRRRPVPVADSVFEVHGNTSPDGDPAQDALDHELWETLSVALSELPWRQRACWLLRELDGLSYEDIARILGTTPTVVRGQLHRARRGLALRMEQWR